MNSVKSIELNGYMNNSSSKNISICINSQNNIRSSTKTPSIKLNNSSE